MQKRVLNFVQNQLFQNFIIILIIINAITMGLETSHEIKEKFEVFFSIFDIFVISIFTLEVLLRIYAHRIEFFKNGWSLFDFFIVGISLVPSSAGFEILRILRVLRLLRLITVVPQMRKIILALVSVIPGMASIAALLILLFYISAIMATGLYAETFPQWFGTLGESFYTLFQIMTLESWSMGIVRPIMEVHPYAWTFFIPFIFIVTFIMINLIVAVVVDAMAEIGKDNEATDEISTQNSHINNEMKELKEEIRELKELLVLNIKN